MAGMGGVLCWGLMPYNPNDPGRSYYQGGGLTGGAFGAPGGPAVPMGSSRGLAGIGAGFAPFRAAADPLLMQAFGHHARSLGIPFLDLTGLTSQAVKPARRVATKVRPAASAMKCGIGG